MSEAASTPVSHLSADNSQHALAKDKEKSLSADNPQNALAIKTKKNPQLDITPTGDSPFLFYHNIISHGRMLRLTSFNLYHTLCLRLFLWCQLRDADGEDSVLDLGSDILLVDIVRKSVGLLVV